jgi:hypothetical protein
MSLRFHLGIPSDVVDVPIATGLVRGLLVDLPLVREGLPADEAPAEEAEVCWAFPFISL